jgi:hypothetical protein
MASWGQGRGRANEDLYRAPRRRREIPPQLAPARGIVNGLGFGLLVWALIALIAAAVFY